MRVLFFTILLSTLYISDVQAQNINFGENTRIVKTFREANATCFLYPKNQYKCACSQLKSHKKEIWSSQPIEKFNGQLSTGNVYISAQRCK